MTRSLENYKTSVRRQFSFLKQTTRLDDLYAKSLPLDQGRGYLLPVCELHATDEILIEKLAHWRKAKSEFYPSQFIVTHTGTASWLRNNVLNVEDRILFLVLDKQGNMIGHLGLANAINDAQEIEIDNVLRGVDQCAGIMSIAMKKLLDWAEEFIMPKKIFLRVFDDNMKAVKFYQRLSFTSQQTIPLHKHLETNGIFYRQAQADETADKHFLRMEYEPEALASVNSLISTAGPSISAREVSYAVDAARHGWNSQWNSYINRFESAFAEYIGVKHALSTSSCTGALHLALAALGIGPGDEVIVPDITWVATANAVVYVGATPVFADVDMDTWCMDPASFKSLITENTKAVIPVHLYGHPAPIDKIVEIARQHKLYIIEDAAPSIGATWSGTKVGIFGDFATFSFQGAKLVVCGEGGMLVTNNHDLYTKAYSIWDQGREPNTFWIKQNGLKYKMSNIQAAIGLGQLERVNELIDAKRRIFSWYEEGLYDVSGLKLCREAKNARSIYWMTSVILDADANISQDEFRAELKKNQVDSRPVFPAISQYPHWPKTQSPQPNALQIGKRGINLPSGVCLQRNQIEYVCKQIRSVMQKA